MSDLTTLFDRIDAEFTALDGKIKRAQAEKLEEHKARQQRLAAFEKRLETLPAIWKPRLEALVERFTGRVKVSPHLSASSRDVDLDFTSDLAKIHLHLSAATDHDARKLILNYDLEIIPVLMQFEKHKQNEWPIDAIDDAAIAAWVDDRIVDFVRTYLSLNENEYYLREHMVVDPVAGVRFPRFAAAATLERDGKHYYFIGDETRREFEAQHGVAPR
jgi:YHS domain-containing protein